MYGTKYILPFNNDLQEFYEIYFDFLGYTGIITIIDGTDDALSLQCTAGDEDRLATILGTEAAISILVDVDTPLSITDLIAQEDNQIRVTVFKDKDYTTNIFQGFIVVEDNSQPFLDPPFVLSVRALDGLGLLKGVDLVDDNNLKFVGNFSIISWICQILYKTGQTQNLRVFFNYFEESFATNINPLEQTFLDSITFSQGDSFNTQANDPSIDTNALTADDCYTALEKIVRCFRCRLFQEDGRWNLISIGEYFNPNGYSFTEYSIGAPVSGIVPFTPVNSGKNITFNAAAGSQEIVHQVNDDQNIYLKIATKFIHLEFDYNQSENKICNQDMTDISAADRNPAYDEVISTSILDASITPVVNLTTQGYEAYCWTHLNGNVIDIADYNAYPSSAPSTTAFIRDVIDLLGYSTNRFFVLKSPGHNQITYLRSNRFLIDTNDILQLSISWRTRVNLGSSGSSGYPIAFVYLYGDDGSHWALFSFGDGTDSSNPTKWNSVDSNFHAPLSAGGSFPIITGVVTDTITWNSTSVNQAIAPNGSYAKAPVSGQVELLLIYPQIGGDAQESWFKDISVTILPYMQGSYKQLKGDFNYSAANLNIKQTLSADVEISDSPKRYFKGALLRANGDLCTPTWKSLTASATSRFTQIMEQIMYTCLYRMVHKIEGSWRGLIYLDNADPTQIHANGLLNSWNFSDAGEPTKKYMLTSFDKNIATGEWRGVFVETLKDQNDTGLVAPDDYEFNYIFE